MNENLENVVLDAIIGTSKPGMPLTVFTTNGFQCRGHLVGWNDKVIVVRDKDEKINMIYKHAVSTIQPAADIPGISQLP